MYRRKGNENHLAELSSEVRDNEDASREERYQAIDGETSTEGVGRGFDETEAGASEEEKAEATADGPSSGDSIDPPNVRPGKKRKTKKGVQPPHSKSNHAAAYNTKAF